MSTSTIESIAEVIKNKDYYLIGVAGIPGSGKSYFSQKLSQLLQHSIVISMDGYHIYRKHLTEEGIKYRGAAFTFDLQKFKHKV